MTILKKFGSASVPAERFLFVVGTTHIYSGSNNKRESATDLPEQELIFFIITKKEIMGNYGKFQSRKYFDDCDV